MPLKKETKWTVVYELDQADPTSMDAPVNTVYVSKRWLNQQGSSNRWPRAIEVEVRLPSD